MINDTVKLALGIMCVILAHLSLVPSNVLIHLN